MAPMFGYSSTLFGRIVGIDPYPNWWNMLERHHGPVDQPRDRWRLWRVTLNSGETEFADY